MKTPILETERLLLRPLTVADAQEAYENWTSDPDVTRYMVYCTHTSVEDTKAWLTDVEKMVEGTEYEWGFVRKSDGKLIGSGSIYYKEKADAYSLGYNLMKDCWHQGYAAEAVAAMIRFGIDTLGIKKFIASHAKENPNSGRVMEKAGLCYVQDGEYVKLDGTAFAAKFYEMIVGE